MSTSKGQKPVSEWLNRADRYPFACGENRGAQPQDKPDLAVPNVLVIDDEPVARKQLERLYGQNGYSVVAFSSGEAGLRRLEHDDIDLVITDIKLPGIDG